MNSLSALTNLTIYPSPPSVTIDMAGAILSVPAIEFGTMGDNILMIQTQFHDETQIDGYFILIPDLLSYEKILKVARTIADLKEKDDITIKKEGD